MAGAAACSASVDRKIRVLLVKDEATIHRVVARALLKKVGGVELLDEAENGTEAVRRVRERAGAGAGASYDLILSDSQMPGPSWTATRSRGGSVPWACRRRSSGVSSDCDVDASSTRAGADDFAHKPLNKEKLDHHILAKFGLA